MNDKSAASPVIDINRIFEYLPHRYPFLLVDRVVELTPGERILGYKNVTINEGFFNGHFPEKPILPGVLIVEAMAQISGILAFETNNSRPSDGVLYFLGATDKTRFRRPVTPGDRLMLESELRGNRKRVMKFTCQATVDEVVVCRSELTIMAQSGDF